MDAQSMSHKRLLAIAAFAVLSFAVGFAVALHGSPRPARADSCTLSTCNTGGGGGGGNSGGGTTSPPTHQAAPPPGRVTDLVLNNRLGAFVKLSWTLPQSSNLKKVYVLRTPASQCSSGITDGMLVGGTTAVRTSATDRTAVPGTKYCYTVFVTNTAGKRSPANEIKGARPDLTPPPVVTRVQAAPLGSAIKVTWSPAPTATHYIVLRTAGGACASSPSTTGATRLGGPKGTFATPTATDSTARPGQTYCYSVFPVDVHGNVQKTAASSTSVGLSATPPPGGSSTSPPITGTTPPGKSSNHLISSAVAQIVAAVGVAVIVFGLIVLAGLKLQGSFSLPERPTRRTQGYPYGRPRNGMAMRLHLSDYDTRALVIPAVLGLGALLVIAAVAALVV
jgi:hypothetical protein